MIRKIYILILAAAWLTSCQTVLDDMDLGETPDLITVDGVFTDSAMVHTFKLSKTRDYFGKEEFVPITGAEVTITDLTTGQLVGKLNESAEIPGSYQTEADKQGIAGHAYRLDISAGENRYQAIDTLFAVNDIDGLYIDPFEFYTEWNALYLDATDPADETNFYFWKLYFNDEEFADYKNVPFAEDKFIESEIKHIMLYFDDLDDNRDHITTVEDSVVIRVQQFGISREGYDFIYSLWELLNKGSMFDSPMAQVKTNVWRLDANGQPIEKQTGFFMTAGIDEKSMVYKPEKK